MTTLITGARRGIGAALAVGLAAPGEDLILHHLGAAHEVDAVAVRCRAAGATVRVIDADLSTPDGVAALAEEAGSVDALVNNAARASNIRFGDVSIEEWNATFAVNVTAPMLLAQALVPSMRERGRGGRIVNITSATVRLGGPSGPSYVSSKAALVGLTRSLARDLGPDSITVNAVSPGAIQTESEVELSREANQRDLDASILARQALPRRLIPADLVGVVRFLLSDSASGLTGQVIEVGAGLVYR